MPLVLGVLLYLRVSIQPCRVWACWAAFYSFLLGVQYCYTCEWVSSPLECKHEGLLFFLLVRCTVLLYLRVSIQPCRVWACLAAAPRWPAAGAAQPRPGDNHIGTGRQFKNSPLEARGSRKNWFSSQWFQYRNSSRCVTGKGFPLFASLGRGGGGYLPWSILTKPN